MGAAVAAQWRGRGRDGSQASESPYSRRGWLVRTLSNAPGAALAKGRGGGKVFREMRMASGGGRRQTALCHGRVVSEWVRESERAKGVDMSERVCV